MSGEAMEPSKQIVLQSLKTQDLNEENEMDDVPPV